MASLNNVVKLSYLLGAGKHRGEAARLLGCQAVRPGQMVVTRNKGHGKNSGFSTRPLGAGWGWIKYIKHKIRRGRGGGHRTENDVTAFLKEGVAGVGRPPR